MNETLKKFSAELLKDFKAALEKQETDEVIAKTEADSEGQEFTFVVSTSAIDRQGDELDQSKWNFANFKKNPVILWAHNYGEPPIGICTDIKTEGEQTVATVKFAPADANPFAAQIAALVQEGYLNATSVGYIEHDDGSYELLEISVVPVPANAQALSVREAEKMGLNLPQLVMKGFSFTTKGAVPYKDHGKADPDTAWDGPAEVKECGEDFKKLKDICAWYDAENPDVKSSYKLPHHRASDLKAVWNGVRAAMGALKGARGGADIPEKDKHAVYSHLAKHYKEFDKEPPEFEKAVKAEEVGDSCEMPDGSLGVLAEDSDNPGKLVCVPKEDGKGNKAAKDEHEELHKALTSEHERHAKAIVKSIDEFREKALGDEKKAARKEDHEKAIDEFTEKMEGEHADHLEKTLKAIDENYQLEDQAPKKSIDEYRKAMKDEHEKHVKTFEKAIDEFKKDWPDGDPSEPETREEGKKAIDEFEEKAEKELARHKKAALDTPAPESPEDPDGDGDNDQADDEDKKILELLARKSGREISAKNKEKIKSIIDAAVAHHEKQIAALKDLIGPDAGSEEEEQKPEKSGAAPKPKVEVRDIRPTSDTFEAFMVNRQVLRTVDKAVGQALEDLNQKFRKHFPARR
ncbi:MAG TPA: hypothetical protein VNJ52_05025 [Patescibacteria group bacterium]|nr:hypothetical protein [Patescibacteria group bacterium]